MTLAPVAHLDRPALALVRGGSSRLSGLSDAALLAGQKRAIEAVRSAHLEVAMYAAEVARRSGRDLGHRGLAQREGARSAEQLLERAGGMAPDEARAIVRMGAVLAAVEGGSSGDESEGGSIAVAGASRVIAESVSSGSLSMQAADAIVTALGSATDTVSAESLTDAATLLVAVAPELTIRAVSAEARACAMNSIQLVSQNVNSGCASAATCTSPFSPTA